MTQTPSFTSVRLLLDSSSVVENIGCTFHLNHATMHPDNPLLEPGLPHEWDGLQVSWPTTVLYNDGERKFRCWYSGLETNLSPKRYWHMGYAESDDGIHWVKPIIGAVEHLGQPTNRIAMDEKPFIALFFFENPTPNAPESQRFVSYWNEDTHTNGPGRFIKVLAYSPDGKHWTRDGVAYASPDGTRPPFHDINQLVFRPDHPDPAWRVLGLTQIVHPRWDGRVVRHIGIVHGETFKRVDAPKDAIVLAPQQGIDEELHFAIVNRIGDSHVMLFESNRFARNPIDGDLRLAVSDDGRTYRRVHPHETVLDTGPRGSWCENMLTTTFGGMLEVGDEHWVYFHGCPRGYNCWPSEYAKSPELSGSRHYPVAMGLATLPLHRFGYAQGPGEIIVTAGNNDEVWINTDGVVNVSALDANGREVARGVLGNERKRMVYRKISWDRPPQNVAQFRLTLKENTHVYSIAVE